MGWSLLPLKRKRQVNEARQQGQLLVVLLFLGISQYGLLHLGQTLGRLASKLSSFEAASLGIQI